MCFDIILVMDNYEQKIDECLNEFGSNKNGLTQDEAVERLSKNGKNELPQKKKTPNIVKFLKQFCDIMIIILLVAAVVSITMAVIQKDDTLSNIALRYGVKVEDILKINPKIKRKLFGIFYINSF